MSIYGNAFITSGSGESAVITETPLDTGGTRLELTAIDLSRDTVAADKMLSGYTAHSKTGTAITGTIASKSAQTYTPGTKDQEIAAGQYLAGAQTIRGDSNLIPSNIASGVTIFGVTGTHSGGGSTSTTEEAQLYYYNWMPADQSSNYSLLFGNATDGWYTYLYHPSIDVDSSTKVDLSCSPEMIETLEANRMRFMVATSDSNGYINILLSSDSAPTIDITIQCTMTEIDGSAPTIIFGTPIVIPGSGASGGTEFTPGPVIETDNGVTVEYNDEYNARLVMSFILKSDIYIGNTDLLYEYSGEFAEFIGANYIDTIDKDGLYNIIIDGNNKTIAVNPVSSQLSAYSPYVITVHININK